MGSVYTRMKLATRGELEGARRGGLYHGNLQIRARAQARMVMSELVPWFICKKLKRKLY